jgi:catalase
MVAANHNPESTPGNKEFSGEPAPVENRPAPLSSGSMLARLASIAILLLAVVAAFLYLGGWFSPQKLTPSRFVDEFERANGKFSSFRRNHAKGVCVSGFFESNGNGARLSKAVVFRSAASPSAAAILMPATNSAPSAALGFNSPWPMASSGAPP